MSLLEANMEKVQTFENAQPLTQQMCFLDFKDTKAIQVPTDTCRRMFLAELVRIRGTCPNKE